MDLIGDILNYQYSQTTLGILFKGVKIAEDAQSENKILPREYLKKMTYWNSNFNSLLIKNNWSPNYFRLLILESLYQDLGHAYGKVIPNQQRLLFYLSKAIDLGKSEKDTAGLAWSYSIIAEYFSSTDQPDSCLLYAEKANALRIVLNNKQPSGLNSLSGSLALLGNAYFKKGNYPLALKLSRQSTQIAAKHEVSGSLPWENWLAYFTLSEYFLNAGAIDSSLYYGIEANKITMKMNLPEEMRQTSAMLAKLYKKINENDSALKYFELSSALSDTLNSTAKKRQLQRQDFEEQLHQQELEDERAKLKFYILIGGLVILLIITFFLLKNNQHRKKSNAALQQKNQEIENTLSELKSTQAQLIQSEKMASLGELTAGIAHEIQNPLNFVNNFSEVNRELISELVDEVDAGNTEEVKLIANDIKANEEKINHHGKRADAIVKGMLQHSRQTKGVKEPTDINALCDEYLRLSYHGLRAKDKNFNADFKTDFDESIGKINIVPQDISRVMLNILTNAFYAVNEKSKNLLGLADLTSLENYKPLVSVQTKKINDKVEIIVEDNGNGIPQNIIDKIFQPFFTTKPTGQGTGLGLSLAYDIITKEHNGTIKVESKERLGTEFIIQLPITA